jgi:hypothetical protein
MTESWTSRDVQRNPAGFREAQRKEAELREAESKKQREQDELERFTRQFVAAGGDPGDAEEAEFKRTRNERATQSARAKEETALREMRERRSRAV